MAILLLLGLFAPLIGFVILLVSSMRIGRGWTGLVACGALFLSFVSFTTLFILFMKEGMTDFILPLYSWIDISGVHAEITLYLDALSLLMTLIITGVGFLIHLYSIGYMDHERDYARFFACLNFFVFSMLLLVLAADLLVLFIGWEGVGLASYLLIGFWYERPVAAAAAVKAFVVNRVGDCGFILALLLTLYTCGTTYIPDVVEMLKGAPLLSLITLLYFVGAMGKSAQFPLHVWLADAMAGPTPVSALIHAATMVTAGVYLVVRLHVLYLMTPEVMQLIGTIGGFTALFAALCATQQTDLKKVLAYSTVSQLGLMFLACGVGAFYAAMFHLTTHAFVKALLFLSAGNVVHMMHGTTEMGEMGGLSKIFKKTHWLFLLGALSLSGIPPLSAFFSKDLILEQEYLSGFKVLYFVGLAASILTGFYLMRAYCLTFIGKSHVEPLKEKTIKEAPSIMLGPVMMLALLSTVGGFLGFSLDHTPFLETFLAKSDVRLSQEEPANLFLTAEAWVAIIGASLSIGLSFFLYTRFSDKRIPFLNKCFYIDDILEMCLVEPLQKVSCWINRVAEPSIVEGSIRGMAYGVNDMSTLLQKMQSGQIRSYVAWMLIGAAYLLSLIAF